MRISLIIIVLLIFSCKRKNTDYYLPHLIRIEEKHLDTMIIVRNGSAIGEKTIYFGTFFCLDCNRFFRNRLIDEITYKSYNLKDTIRLIHTNESINYTRHRMD